MTLKQHRCSLIFFMTVWLLCGCDVQHTRSAKNAPSTFTPKSYLGIQQRFEDLNYHWETLNLGVPAVLLARFPEDMHRIRDVKKKKQLFFLSVLPMVLAQNNAIQHQRAQLQRLFEQQDKNSALDVAQQRWLKQLYRDYKFSGDLLLDPQQRQRLLERVDTIPAALVLAQAANESAYGTSRFAQQANNIFGEWTFTPGTGLIPSDRPAGARYEVRIFKSLNDSIRSYLRNLNTHPAYQSFRRVRSQMRETQQLLDAQRLARELLNYSTRRDDYVTEIENMIRYNRLTQLAGLKLRNANLAQLQPILQPMQISSRRSDNGRLLL